MEALHAACFDRQPDGYDWADQVQRHSLGWVNARDDDTLVGWVNIAWDGAGHAFILDTIVASTHRRHGIATALVRASTARAREAGCEWLHVDFEDHLFCPQERYGQAGWDAPNRRYTCKGDSTHPHWETP